MYRKTRIVCVSDTHAYTPSEAGFKLPPGDVLIHAGDLTNQGSTSELRRTIEWIARADYEVKVIIAGNHDITLDPAFHNQHDNSLETTEQCMEIVTKRDPSIVYLCHESAVIRLTRADGPQTAFKVFGSPYSPVTQNGKWAAFGYEHQPVDGCYYSDGYEDNNSTGEVSSTLWNQIPPDTDVVVTHTPPYSHRDRHSQATATSGDDGKPASPVGCSALRQVLQRVRPKIAVCGHVHESRGCERVLWAPPPLMTRGGESDTGGRGREIQVETQVEEVPLPSISSKKQSLVDLTGRRTGRRMARGDGTATNGDESDHAIPATTRQRRETCIVNAAILATSWPHRGGKRFHTPVLVDVDLPVA